MFFMPAVTICREHRLYFHDDTMTIQTLHTNVMGNFESLFKAS